MFVSLGRRAKEPGGLVESLLACHERIRQFIGLAQALGARERMTDGDVAEACVRCARYFREALPLHVQDEEESLLPRLQGRSAEVDGALAEMHRQHAEHEPLIEALLASLEAARLRPDDDERRARATSVAERLGAELEVHLKLEEVAIFPVLREFPPDVQAEIAAELRERRGG